MRSTSTDRLDCSLGRAVLKYPSRMAVTVVVVVVGAELVEVVEEIASRRFHFRNVENVAAVWPSLSFRPALQLWSPCC